MSHHLYNFSQDIKDLYLSIKNTNVEKCFRFISASLHIDILSALKKNKSSIKNKNLYDTFMFLDSVRKKYPTEIKAKELVTELFENPKIISTARGLAEASKDVRVADLLSGYNHIFSELMKYSGASDNVEIIVQDLMLIIEEEQDVSDLKERKNEKIKITKRQRMEEMFKKMLEIFSNNIADVYAYYGGGDISSLLKTQFILGNPDEIFRLLGITNVDKNIVKQCTKIVNSICSKYLGHDNVEFNYMFLRDSAMTYAKQPIQKDKVDEFYRTKRQNQLLRMMGEKPETEDRLIDPFKNESIIGKNDSRWINKQFIVYVTVFFYIFQSKINESL